MNIAIGVVVYVALVLIITRAIGVKAIYRGGRRTW